MIQKHTQHWGTRLRSREEIEETHHIVGEFEHRGHEFAWTVNKFRKPDDYFTVLAQIGGADEDIQQADDHPEDC